MDDNPLLEVEVTLLGEADQDLPPRGLIDLHDRIRAAVYEAVDYQMSVVVRLGSREERLV